MRRRTGRHLNLFSVFAFCNRSLSSRPCKLNVRKVSGQCVNSQSPASSDRISDSTAYSTHEHRTSFQCEHTLSPSFPF